MSNDLDKLLNDLEPVINKKCMEVKKIKKQKKQNWIMIILCLLFVVTPSVLLLFNISIIYFIVGIIIIFLFKFFIKLPDILKMEVNCYE